MPAYVDIDALEDLFTMKLESVDGVRSAFSIGQLDELESERIFKMPAAIVMQTGAPAEPPKVIGGEVVQEGTMSWSVFVIAAGMRGQKRARSGERGANAVAKAVVEAVNGWEIMPGWQVYYVDNRPYNVGEPSKVILELMFAHQFDIEGI